MQADGTLHGSMAEGGLAVPQAAIRSSGYLTNAGGMAVPEYQNLVVSESKAKKVAEIAAAREYRLACSVSAAESDVESLRSELLVRESAAHARRSRGKGQHSLRGANGQEVPFASALVAESLRA